HRIHNNTCHPVYSHPPRNRGLAALGLWLCISQSVAQTLGCPCHSREGWSSFVPAPLLGKQALCFQDCPKASLRSGIGRDEPRGPALCYLSPAGPDHGVRLNCSKQKPITTPKPS